MAEANSTTPRTLTKEYIAWKNMKSRCGNPNDTSYRYYGAIGISVCDRWRDSFEAFLEDVGRAPSPAHSMDRFPDGNGNYEPDNVRWATNDEQQRNTSKCRWITFEGQTLCLADWAKEAGIPLSTLSARLRSGWSMEKALKTPPGPSRPKHRRKWGRVTNPPLTFNGETLRLKAWADRLGVNLSALKSRVRRGWSTERILTTPVASRG